MLTTLASILYVAAFMFGAAWGSFINVLVYRLPRRLSLVRPSSFCPSCETPIRAFDNVPVFGWLWLCGRCRACKCRIPVRYPLVELATALATTLLAWHVFDGRLEAVVGGHAVLSTLLVPYVFLFFYVVALIALFLVDLASTELPLEITLPGILLGLIYAYAVPETGLLFDLVPNVSLFDAVLGAGVGGGVIVAIIMGYFFLTGKVGMGGGDIWMMAMVGAFVGWQGLFFIFFASSVQGLLFAVGAVLFGAKQQVEGDGGVFRNHEVAELEASMGLAEDGQEAGAPAFRKLALPFGPFIALSAFEYIFFGDFLLSLLTGGALSAHGWVL